MDPLIIIFGLGVGLLVGTTGVGGGSVMTPLLILVVGVKPVLAIGTDLAYAAITKSLGGFRHLRLGTVDVRLSLWLAAGSVPAALGGVWVLHLLEQSYGEAVDELVLVLVAIAVLVTGAVVLWRSLFAVGAAERERVTIELGTRHKLAAVALGLGVGFVIGVTSVGSGALIAVGLILLFRLTPRRVVGTDVFQAAILLWAAAAAHFAAGNVDLGLMANILIGSLPGIWIGSGLATRLPEKALRIALGIVLLASGLGLIAKAGAGIPVLAIIGVPLGLAAAAWIVHLLRRRRTVPVSEQD